MGYLVFFPTRMAKSTQRPRVFVVDDDAPILFLMDRLLRAHEFEPRTFPTGAEALEHFGSEKPSVVLLDMHMPGMSGEEFIRRMRETDSEPHTPVLILSGDRLGEASLRQLGAEGAIQKPFQVDALIDAIRACTSRGSA